MLKLIFTVCLFTFAAYLPANEQEDTHSQENVQEAFSCGKPVGDETKDTAEDALACGKHKKDESKDVSEDALACGKHKNDEAKDVSEDALACGKHKNDDAKDVSEDALACGKHKKQKSTIEATEDAEPLAFFCPECTDKEDALLA
jgi:hypothetical protein